MKVTPSDPILRPVMPELDVIRGLAILMVVIYHAFYWQNDMHGLTRVQKLFVYATWTGRMGVNLFFVLSGFLITGLLLQSIQRSDYYRRFYLRRALRIIPAYYATLLILAICRQSTWAYLAFSSVYLSNISPLFGVAMSYPVFWSLAVEEHFYMVWPMIVRHTTPKRLAILSVAIIVVSPLLRWLSFIIEARSGNVFYTFNNYTWNSADGLACGALLVIVLRECEENRTKLLLFSCVAIFGAAVMWVACIPFGILQRQGTPIGAALQITPWNMGFTGLLGLFLLAGTSRWRGLVLWPAFRYLGRISYGLYLIHLLVFDAYDAVVYRLSSQVHVTSGTFSALCIRFVVATCGAVAVAHISREYYENFFLTLKDRFTPSPEMNDSKAKAIA